MSVADASDEFQPKETGYLFGDSDKPGDGVGFANVADEAFLKRKQRSSSERLDDGSKKNSDGTPRKKFWQRRQGGGVIGQRLRAGEGIRWLAAGTMPNSLYRMPLAYLSLTCVFCYSCSFLFVVCVFVFFFALIGAW